MVRYCCVKKCKSKGNSQKECKLFVFPSGSTELSMRRKKLWLEAIAKTDLNPQNALVCYRHFVNGTY